MRDIQHSRRTATDVAAAILAERREHAGTIDAFHLLFYASKQTAAMTYFEDVPVLKNPLDLWVYQEIIWGLRPTLIIETGTAFGGSALYFARQLDRVGEGAVVTVDVDAPPDPPQHRRVTYLTASSTDSDVVEALARVAFGHPRVMVVLDSDHAKSHVLAELKAYAPLVSQGQYLVVEDTDINGRPVPIDWKGGPGPGPAVDEWWPEHPEFQRGVISERYLISSHTWLRRRADGEAEVGAVDAGRREKAQPQRLRLVEVGGPQEGEA